MLLLGGLALIIHGRSREGVAVVVLAMGIPAGIIGWMTITDWLRRGNRVGDSAHCATCDYSLAHAAREICPECGTRISQATIVQGEWRARPIVDVIGAIFAVSLFLSIVLGLATGVLLWMTGQLAVLFQTF